MIAAAVLVITGTAAAISVVNSPGRASHADSSAAANGGALFTSSVGHFRARFPSQPTDLNVPASGTGSVQFNLQGAWCTSPITEIAAETSATPVPAAQQETAMEIALNSFSASAHQTAQGQAPTTYSGRVGRTATFTTPGGTQLTAMVFFYSDTRLYIIVAPTGTAFDDLVASFVALP